MALSNRAQRNTARQEDIKHLLEEVWYCDPDSSFGAIFKRETQGGICELLLHGKSELEQLTCRDDNGDIMKLTMFEIDRIRTLNHYLKYL